MIFKGIELCCPYCKGDLQMTDQEESQLRCVTCGRRFPVVLGIPDLRVHPDPYINIEEDREKGLKLASRLKGMSFGELVDYYYSTTPVVPAKHARQYKRGLMTGVPRSEAALSSWQRQVNSDGRFANMSLLEIGCGTGPLLIAAAPEFPKLVGVDIAFRWLVVAKKRLADAGVAVPLICACAEALPFPDRAFDRVAIESALEHVRNQGRVLAECYRVMPLGGYLFVSIPNRFSLGPDPQAGIWGGGFMPERWLATFVRWQGGIAPKRQLLSRRFLEKLIRQAGFGTPHLSLPEIPLNQRRQVGMGVRVLIYLYHLAIRSPVGRHFLREIAPTLHAVAAKTTG